MEFTYLVRVVRFGTLEVVKVIDVIGLGKAEKVRDGLEINMSGDYFTSITKKDNK